MTHPSVPERLSNSTMSQSFLKQHQDNAGFAKALKILESSKQSGPLNVMDMQ